MQLQRPGSSAAPAGHVVHILPDPVVLWVQPQQQQGASEGALVRVSVPQQLGGQEAQGRAGGGGGAAQYPCGPPCLGSNGSSSPSTSTSNSDDPAEHISAAGATLGAGAPAAVVSGTPVQRQPGAQPTVLIVHPDGSCSIADERGRCAGRIEYGGLAPARL